MTRYQQYRFLVASSLAVVWIASGIKAALGVERGGPIPAVLQLLYLPYTLAQRFGRPLLGPLGLTGSLLALVILWIIFTLALWAMLEGVARLWRNTSHAKALREAPSPAKAQRRKGN